MGAAINRFASLFDGLSRGFLFDPEFRAIVATDLATGRHANPGRRSGWFTTAYLHHPGELQAEAEEAGLMVRALVGLEGLSGWLPFSQERWDSPSGRSVILDAARLTETEPSLAGLSPHLLLVCEEPEGHRPDSRVATR